MAVRLRSNSRITPRSVGGGVLCFHHFGWDLLGCAIRECSFAEAEALRVRDPGTRFARKRMGARRAALMPEPPGTWPPNGSTHPPYHSSIPMPLASPVPVTDSSRNQWGRAPNTSYGQVPVGGIADRPRYTPCGRCADRDMDYMQQHTTTRMIRSVPSTDPVTATNVGGNQTAGREMTIRNVCNRHGGYRTGSHLQAPVGMETSRTLQRRSCKKTSASCRSDRFKCRP